MQDKIEEAITNIKINYYLREKNVLKSDERRDFLNKQILTELVESVKIEIYSIKPSLNIRCEKCDRHLEVKYFDKNMTVVHVCKKCMGEIYTGYKPKESAWEIDLIQKVLADKTLTDTQKVIVFKYILNPLITNSDDLAKAMNLLYQIEKELEEGK